jgi:peptidyl-prolyl cis-trans isomerase B (cyclophilin B)
MSTAQDQGYRSAPAKTNALAVAALFIGMTGVILGHIALIQIKTTGAGGRGLAIAALVIGYVSMTVGAAIIIGIFSTAGHHG